MMENNKCVYLHKDCDGIVRYVGSGGIVRAYQTWANSHRGKAYAEFVKSNGKLKVQIVAEGLAKLEAEDLERKLYDDYKESILNVRRPSSVKLISKEMFEKFLYYDETSSTCLRWKVNICRKIKANSEAGSFHNGDGYYRVGLQGIRYKVHRIIAVLHGLEVNGFVIDHIDRNRTNNKISNLRVVTEKENSQNLSQYKLSSNNSSGIQGVSYNKLGYWVATWYEEGKRELKYFSIKNFESSEQAFDFAVEYRKQMIDLHYNFKE